MNLNKTEKGYELSRYSINGQLLVKEFSGNVTFDKAYFEIMELKDDKELEEIRLKQLQEQQEKIIEKLIDKDKDLKVLDGIFKTWEKDTYYAKGTILTHSSKLYKVVQSHKSEAHREPGQKGLEALYVQVAKPNEILYFELNSDGSKRNLAVNPYMKNEQVIFEGFIYTSNIDNNVWSPRDYPQGWKKEREV